MAKFRRSSIRRKPSWAKSDAAIVQFRHGDLHLPYAMPLIEKGLPVFIDKPFCLKVEDCKRLVEAARKYRAPIFSCSAFRYDRLTREFTKDYAKRRAR